MSLGHSYKCYNFVDNRLGALLQQRNNHKLWILLLFNFSFQLYG